MKRSKRASSSSRSSSRSSRNRRDVTLLEKAATGIEGFDSVTHGGLPKGRPTLVCGTPGCGKTLFGLQFVINGALTGEPGVVVSFEETADDLEKNVASLGVDLAGLVRRKKITIDHVHVDRGEILETGGYDLSGLFVRLEAAIDSVGAKRVLIDTIEVLFSGFSDQRVLRSELERLFHWLKEKGVTAVITGEAGTGGMLTRNGLEEYVSDCVIALDQRIYDQVCTRRMRIVKYRGSSHGTNEYPFMIGESGITVLPITTLGLDYPVSTERVPTGVPAVDAMLSQKGYFRGSSILVSGTAGTGKSGLVAAYVRAACERGERCIYLALEEPAAQVVRNMRSIGIDLQPYVERGLLQIISTRPSFYGLEQHLVSLYADIERFKPRSIVVDPISSWVEHGNAVEVKAMLVRLFDYLKMKRITGLFTYLSGPTGLEETVVGVSSLIDTWIELRDLEAAGERNRAMYVLKSRGMSHSNQVREFLITSKGIDLVDAFVGPEGVAVGSARLVKEAEAEATRVARALEGDRRKRAAERRRKLVEAQIEALRLELESEEEEAATSAVEETTRIDVLHRTNESLRQSALGARSQKKATPRERS
ncbi:MAG TPA: circadian clock protein KaiC [Polyangiaceae bacterium]